MLLGYDSFDFVKVLRQHRQMSKYLYSCYIGVTIDVSACIVDFT